MYKWMIPIYPISLSRLQTMTEIIYDFIYINFTSAIIEYKITSTQQHPGLIILYAPLIYTEIILT